MKTTELYDLAHDGNVEAIAKWLDARPDDLNAFMDDGMAPLHVACMFGHETLVRYLIGRGALVNLNAMNSSRVTPLHLAVGFRDETIAAQIAQLLIASGAELNAPQDGGQTPLHHAVARGSSHLVEVLVRNGADPFLKDGLGRSSSDLARELPPEKSVEEIQAALKGAFSLSFES
jgi:uncharacterized protein